MSLVVQIPKRLERHISENLSLPMSVMQCRKLVLQLLQFLFREDILD